MRIIRDLVCLMAVCLLSCFVFPFSSMTALAYETITAEIPVACLEIPDGNNHTYTIIIESESEFSPAPVSDTLEISENGTGKFEIDINEPGTFIYRIFEKSGSESNIEYDDNIYEITIFVENTDNDELKYAVTASVDGVVTKAEQVAFEHRSKAETAATTTTASTSTTASSATTAGTSTVTTASVTTSGTEDKSGKSISGFIDNVLTGDSFPIRALRITMLLSVLAAVSAFLFKRDKDEEEDKNEK